MEKITLEEILKISPKEMEGKTICFPTDTVYGIGAMITDNYAISKIYEMKNRIDSKPLPILCSNIQQITDYINPLSDEQIKLMNNYWPGALTIIFKKTNRLSDFLTKGLSTVAFRMPNSEISLKLINHFGLLATTSANISGQKELNSLDQIEKEFSDKIDYFVLDQNVMENVPSTIVDCTSHDTKVLRQGKIIIKNV